MSNLVVAHSIAYSLEEAIEHARMVVDIAGGAEAEHELAKAIALKNKMDKLLNKYNAAVCEAFKYAECPATSEKDAAYLAAKKAFEKVELAYMLEIAP